MDGIALRKIVHVDLDAFYASIEQRDNPSLVGRPVVVAWRGKRSVVCAASYEARRFGVRSAMPAVRAERLCPEAVFVPPDFTRYRAASEQVRAIFRRHTDLVEPLSLDEAYLDVTVSKTGFATATAIAREIRAEIFAETRLTASAGVAPNKFLAKIASEVRKPNGLFVIQPKDVLDFLTDLPVGRVPGVGAVTEKRLHALGMTTVGAIRAREAGFLEQHFGKYGRRLYELARGIDERPVQPNLPTQSISAEDTFEIDVPLDQTEARIRSLSDKVWTSLQKERRTPRTVVLKLKTAQFQILTRSHTPVSFPHTAEALAATALALRERVGGDAQTLYRLVGVGVSNFCEPEVERNQLIDFT